MSRRIFPVSASAQTANNSFAFSVAVVSQICLFQVMGDDHARPWMAVFHFTFCSSLHVIGTLFVSACPSPLGPRNCGQLEADATQQETNTASWHKRMLKNCHDVA